MHGSRRPGPAAKNRARDLAAIAAIALAACAAPARSLRPPPDPAPIEQFAATWRFGLGRPSEIHPGRGGREVLFLRSGPRSFVKQLFELDVATNKERVLLTAEQLLAGGEEKLSAEERARRERMRLAERGIVDYQLSEDERIILVPLSARLFLYDRAAGESRELPSGEVDDAVLAPDGGKVAFVREGDVFVYELASGRTARLTTHSSTAVGHGLAEFVAQEEMGRYRGLWWSPASDVLLVQRTDVSRVELRTIADPLHPEEPAERRPYPRPGGANAEVELGVVRADGKGGVRWIGWDRSRFPYLATVRWDRGGPPLMLVQDRAQREEVLFAIDPERVAIRELLWEIDPAWLNIDQSVPRWLADGRGFVWSTERRGAQQLELRGPDGAALAELTPAEPGYVELLSVDAERGEVWYSASPDPFETHLFRAPLDPSRGKPERVSAAPGDHGAAFARDHRIWVRTREPLGGGVVAEVLDRSGLVLAELADRSERPLLEPRIEITELASAAPGITLKSAILRPSFFDRSKRWPVLVYVYGGPHGRQVVASNNRYPLLQWLSENGLVVLLVDGRGTEGRGRAFERALAGSFVKVPLADQIAGLADALARHPELDPERVAIFGWSYGGYMAAMAAMLAPDRFRAAVAGAPVTDWLDYDTHYTERYVGLPIGPGDAYAKSSVLEAAERLSRPLLIVHGVADDNVYFSHSLALADRLFRAGKRFELLPLAGATHMVADPVLQRTLYQTIAEFICRELRC